MKKQGGFTLIELVVVIVILGILAVTAAPKFLNLQSDARASSLQGLKGAMSGASGIVYGKSAIEGVETKAGQEVDGIKVEYGYPKASTDGIGEAVVGLTEDWTAYVDGQTFVATFQDDDLADAAAVKGTECFVTYSEATTESSGVSVTVTDDKC